MNRFFKKYIFATDHKTIGVQFVFTSLFWLVIGTLLAIAIRWHVAWPWADMPLFGPWLFAERGGQISPDFLSVLLSMHGTVMIFFFMIPLLVGGVGNCLMPGMIGARETAFPRLNMFSYWLMWPGFVLIGYCFFELAKGPAPDVSNHPALMSQIIMCPGGSLPQILWICGLLFVSISTLTAAINMTTTIVQSRTTGMSFERLPMTVWATLFTSMIQMIAVPLIVAALSMQLSDRLFDSSFFENRPPLFDGATGHEGVTLWSQIFGLYSRVSLLAMTLPAFGMVFDVVACLARKSLVGARVSAKSMGGLAIMGLISWMLGVLSSVGFSQMQYAIVVATALAVLFGFTLLFNLLATLRSARIQFSSAMLFCFAFLGLLTVGTAIGWVTWNRNTAGSDGEPFPVAGHLPVAGQIPIVDHFHFVILGSGILGVFAGIYFWYPMLSGKLLGERLGKLHFWLTLIFLNTTFWLLFFAGESGFANTTFVHSGLIDTGVPSRLDRFLTCSAVGLGLSQLVFAVNVLVSGIWGRRAPANPWRSTTLEWVKLPDDKPLVVHRGPYEYGNGMRASGDRRTNNQSTEHPSFSGDGEPYFFPQNEPVQTNTDRPLNFSQTENSD